VDLETAHYPHEADCPNRIVDVQVDCTCDLVTHPQCRPECQAHGEHTYEQPVARALGLDREGPTVTAAEHRYDPDSDCCACGGVVVFFEDGASFGFGSLLSPRVVDLARAAHTPGSGLLVIR
jgi:hypothetical protein